MEVVKFMFDSKKCKRKLEIKNRYLSVGITLVYVHLNWLNWFRFLIPEGDLPVIRIDCMIFLSPFLDVAKMSMSTVSFLAQLDSGILCL